MVRWRQTEGKRRDGDVLRRPIVCRLYISERIEAGGQMEGEVRECRLSPIDCVFSNTSMAFFCAWSVFVPEVAICRQHDVHRLDVQKLSCYFLLIARPSHKPTSYFLCLATPSKTLHIHPTSYILQSPSSDLASSYFHIPSPISKTQ